MGAANNVNPETKQKPYMKPTPPILIIFVIFPDRIMFN